MVSGLTSSPFWISRVTFAIALPPFLFYSFRVLPAGWNDGKALGCYGYFFYRRCFCYLSGGFFLRSFFDFYYLWFLYLVIFYKV